MELIRTISIRIDIILINDSNLMIKRNLVDVNARFIVIVIMPCCYSLYFFMTWYWMFVGLKLQY